MQTEKKPDCPPFDQMSNDDDLTSILPPSSPSSSSNNKPSMSKVKILRQLSLLFFTMFTLSTVIGAYAKNDLAIVTSDCSIWIEHLNAYQTAKVPFRVGVTKYIDKPRVHVLCEPFQSDFFSWNIMISAIAFSYLGISVLLQLFSLIIHFNDFNSCFVSSFHIFILTVIVHSMYVLSQFLIIKLRKHTDVYRWNNSAILALCSVCSLYLALFVDFVIMFFSPKFNSSL